MDKALYRDKIDRKILTILQGNARTPASAIAKKLNISPSTVNERIARLERCGTIVGYTVILNQNAEEETIQGILMLSVEKQRILKSVVTQLMGWPEIKVCQDISGTFDLLLIIETASLNAMSELLDEISVIPGVTQVASSVTLATRFDRRQQETPVEPNRAVS